MLVLHLPQLLNLFHHSQLAMHLLYYLAFLMYVAEEYLVSFQQVIHVLWFTRCHFAYKEFFYNLTAEVLNGINMVRILCIPQKEINLLRIVGNCLS